MSREPGDRGMADRVIVKYISWSASKHHIIMIYIVQVVGGKRKYLVKLCMDGNFEDNKLSETRKHHLVKYAAEPGAEP